MRALYNQWLDSGKQTVTTSGNVRAPSRTDICDMVVEAWNDIPEEMIAKSFADCGQAVDCRPEQISCMKEGKVGSPALEKVKEFWDFLPDQFQGIDLNQIQEVDESEEMDVIDVESSDDEEIV